VNKKDSPWWVRTIGGLILLGLLFAAILIVGRAGPAADHVSRTSRSNSVADVSSEPSQSLTTDEFAFVQQCVADDARPRTAKSTLRLLRVLGIADLKGVSRKAKLDLLQVASHVEQLRGLRFLTPIRVTFVSRNEVARSYNRATTNKYTRRDAENDELLLEALNVLDEESDLYSLLSTLQSSFFAGFYIPDKDELIVPSRGADKPLTPFDKVVLAHELEHALVDQRLRGFDSDEIDEAQYDASLAARSVVEGSATLAGQRYAVAALDFDELGSLQQDPRATAPPPPGMPHYLIGGYQFPYDRGLYFVCYLYTTGGWKAVNRAIRNPPETTLEILNPNLYLDGFEARDQTRPPALGSGWRYAHRTTFGAADLFLLFQAPGNDLSRSFANPHSSARSWAGGEIHLWRKGDESAVLLELEDRDHQLCGSVAMWYERSISDEDFNEVTLPNGYGWTTDSQTAFVYCPPSNQVTQVRLGVGPDPETARNLVYHRSFQ
jgi:hypothetical protein